MNDPAWKPEAIDREALRDELAVRPNDLKTMLEKMVANARVEIPNDYDIESAFADALSLGAVDAPKEIQGAILRLSVFLFDRLPGKGESL